MLFKNKIYNSMITDRRIIPKDKHGYISYYDKLDNKYNVHNKLINVHQLREFIGGYFININNLLKIAQQYTPDVMIRNETDVLQYMYEDLYKNKIKKCKYHLIRKSLCDKIRLLTNFDVYLKISPFYIQWVEPNLNIRMYCNHQEINLFFDINKETINIFFPNQIIELLGHNKKIKITMMYMYTRIDAYKNRIEALGVV